MADLGDDYIVAVACLNCETKMFLGLEMARQTPYCSSCRMRLSPITKDEVIDIVEALGHMKTLEG